MKMMNKVLAGQSYVANFLGEPLTVGSVFRMDDEQFILALEFQDVYPELNLGKYTASGSKATIRFSEQKDVAISFGASATTTLGDSEVLFKFKRARSVAGILKDVFVESLKFDSVLEQLKEIWQKRGFSKYLREYFLVFQVMTAASGTLIYSDEKNNEVVLKHKLGEKVSSMIDLGSGQFDYVSNTKRTLEIIRETAHKPLFKAFRFNSNWEPEVLGH